MATMNYKGLGQIILAHFPNEHQCLNNFLLMIF